MIKVESSSEQSLSDRGEIGRANLLKAFSTLLLAGFLLRIFYAGHLFQDDGLWLTAAEEVLRGRALYSEIYFDKPPAIALLYAALFKLFGAHILTIRLFTIFYAAVISAVLYLFGSHLYNRRIGLISAAMFTVFSTTYLTGHMQGLNTDFLMTLPYTAGAYFFARSLSERQQRARARLALLGGALAGIAFQINPKAAFDLVFFAALLAASMIAGRSSIRRSSALVLLLAAVAGFIAGAAPFWAYIAANGAMSDYKRFVWDWGSRYAAYVSVSDAAVSAVRQTASYFALNNTLLLGLLFVIGRVVGGLRRKGDETPGAIKALEAGFEPYRFFGSDTTILLWLAVSFAGMSAGGRFFAHYFFQIIPALCLVGARGLIGIIESLNRRGYLLRRAALVFIAIGFAFTIVRFHSRTVALAVDWARGTRSETTAGWFHERLKREERMAAAVVRDWPGGAEAADSTAIEEFRKESPRTRAPFGPQDYLFVWGYRPEIYYWSGMLPASRFLSTQPLTGVAADVHYYMGEHGYLLSEAETAPARAELLGELSEIRPKYIIDELGFFNNHLSIRSYPELAEFMKGYSYRGATGRFFIYQRRDTLKQGMSN